MSVKQVSNGAVKGFYHRDLLCFGIGRLERGVAIQTAPPTPGRTTRTAEPGRVRWGTVSREGNTR